jgi:isoaspartyl peptidase/L-asparaginase-like protein (Ntn-hydrolase superfamily)
MIGVDAKGNISMRFTTTSMVRAAMNAQGKRIVEIW